MQVLHAEVASAVRVACAEGAAEAVNEHHYQDRTTQLTASIRGDEGLELTARGANGQITAGEKYASYVEAWERGEREFSFMDVASAKAEAVLTREIETTAVARAEARANSR